MSGLPPTALISGLSKQDDADTVMRRAAAAAQPSNGNVLPFPQQGVSSATQPVYNQATGSFDQRQRPPAPVAGQSGVVTPGNIDLNARPIVQNPDGSYSTVRSITIGIDGGRAALIPTVSDDGRVMSDEEAVQQFRKSGKHLGIFANESAANSYAQSLHQSQADQYGPAARSNPSAIRAQTVAWWQQNAGVPRHVAEGIADQVDKESGFRPTLVGDDGTSVGLYQAHLERMASLQSKPNWQNPTVQHAWALSQVMGGDQVATQHWNEIKNAPTREEASRLWQQYFERPAGSAGAAHEQHISTGREELSRVGAQLSRVVEQISKEGGRSEETWKRLREATDKMNEYQGKLLELAQKPPSPEPRDIFSRLGGLATVVGILGGALTRSPLATSLDAGAAAMDAYNKNDLLTYQFQRENWKTQIGVIEKLATFQNEQIRNVLYDERMEQGEKMNRLHALLSALGHEEQAAQAQLGDERSIRNFERQLGASTEALKQRREQFDREQTERERHDLAMEGKPKGSETKFGSIDDLMRRWHDDFVSKNSREPSTDEIAQKRSEIQQETKPIGQVGQNVAERIMIGANDVAKTLEALKELPGGTTLGIFGGAQAALGPNMRENVGKALANAATPEASQVLRALSTGVGRALASLVSAGASQGTQMLAEQLKADFPETNDTGLTIASKMADIRQISEAALEVLQNDPRLNPKQQTKVKEVLDKIQASVPFTTADVARLVNPENRERFTQFAEKLGLIAGSARLPTDLPSPEGHAEGSTVSNNGKVIAVIRNGKWAAP